MGIFTLHTDETAPKEAAEILAKIKERYGFIPNLAAHIAESPAVLGAVLTLVGAYDKVTLSAQEQQIVMLTASALNGCDYCRTVHFGLGRMADLSEETLKATISFEPLRDKKLNALRDFTRLVVEERGWVDESKVQIFLEAGFTKAQVFEVVLGVALKMLTNYCNHVAGAQPNQEFVAMAAGKAAA